MYRILIVDHDPLSRATIEKIVLSLGHDPVIAADAASAFRSLAWSNIHSVLLAASSPNLDAPTLLARIARRWPGVACALLAANDEPVAVIRGALATIRTDYSARTTRPLRASASPR